jgi:hypothetical protein
MPSYSDRYLCIAISTFGQRRKALADALQSRGQHFMTGAGLSSILIDFS